MVLRGSMCVEVCHEVKAFDSNLHLQRSITFWVDPNVQERGVWVYVCMCGSVCVCMCDVCMYVYMYICISLYIAGYYYGRCREGFCCFRVW